uniref:C-type lectin domain-containing protein n=1 Tax=Panagrolaimus sp. JU765 TaxID=591449 RepID=A0AC34RLH0_9BILA
MKLILLVLTVATMVVSSVLGENCVGNTVDVPQCPYNWMIHKFGNNYYCFTIVTGNAYQYFDNQNCKRADWRSNAAVVKNVTELNALANYYRYAYIGLFDNNSQRHNTAATWRWSDGTPFRAEISYLMDSVAEKTPGKFLGGFIDTYPYPYVKVHIVPQLTINGLCKMPAPIVKQCQTPPPTPKSAVKLLTTLTSVKPSTVVPEEQKNAKADQIKLQTDDMLKKDSPKRSRCRNRSRSKAVNSSTAKS